ncbi:MAG: MATE family efflux transporter [Rhodospirillales bacterium]|nr:MATE family efflux transporter [Rhodospirillales bacterium]
MTVAATLHHASPAIQQRAARSRRAVREFNALFRLAGPIAAVGLLNMGMSLTDVIMVGWLGADALAAVAVMSDAYSIVFYLAAGILAATAPLIAHARGAGRQAAVRQTVRHGIWTAGIVAIPAAGLVWLAPDLMAALGLSPALVELGAPYGRVMACTVALMVPVALWRQVLSAHERPQVFMWFTAAALPLNAAGNYLLMFGALGFPGIGIVGAAVSSAMVAAAMAIGLTLYAMTAPGLSECRIGRDLTRISATRLIEILRIGLPIGLSSLAEVGTFLTATIVIAVFPAESVAAHTITLRVAGVFYGPLNAIGQAATVRTALANGARDRASLRLVERAALVAGVTVGGVFLVALAGASQTLPWAFLPAADPKAAQAASLAAGLLVLLGLCQVAQGMGSAVLGILRGWRDVRVPMILNIASQWGVGFPIGMVLAFGSGFGAAGIWTGLLAGTAVAAVANLARWRMLSRRR